MIVVGGEALIDLTEVELGGEQLWRAHPGGGPHNAAVALARLGVPVAFLGRLSSDEFGRRLREGLRADGVDLRFVVTGDEPTTVALVSTDEDGSPRFAFHGEGTADTLLGPADLPATLDGIEALHLGTLGLVREPQASTLVGLMRRQSGRIAQFCDPNIRPALVGDRSGYLRRVRQWADLVDIVKFSDDDLAWLRPDTDPLEEAARWAEDHQALVILTRGVAGAEAFWAGDHAHVDAVAIDVVDTVGAGDSFGAGFLAELRSRVPLRPGLATQVSHEAVEASLAFAARVAARTCARAGADPPRADEL